jgi:hypothetical protein
MRHDYRVRVYINFDVDVSAASAGFAEASVKDIVKEVFKQNFGRAQVLEFTRFDTRNL